MCNYKYYGWSILLFLCRCTSSQGANVRALDITMFERRTLIVYISTLMCLSKYMFVYIYCKAFFLSNRRQKQLSGLSRSENMFVSRQIAYIEPVTSSPFAFVRRGCPRRVSGGGVKPNPKPFRVSDGEGLNQTGSPFGFRVSEGEV